MAAEPTFTWDEIKKHNKEDDCWVVVSGKVYDVTDFVDEHPGSFAPILTSAGKDATKAFVDKPHSKRAYKMLEKFYKGIVDPSAAEATLKVEKAARPEVEEPVVDRKVAEKDSAQDTKVRKHKITFSELVTHNKKDNLWILVHGKVYDVTNFKTHPGSFDKLLQNSAKDASSEFDRVGHKAGSIKMMDKYYIGEIDPDTVEKTESGPMPQQPDRFLYMGIMLLAALGLFAVAYFGA